MPVLLYRADAAKSFSGGIRMNSGRSMNPIFMLRLEFMRKMGTHAPTTVLIRLPCPTLQPRLKLCPKWLNLRFHESRADSRPRIVHLVCSRGRRAGEGRVAAPSGRGESARAPQVRRTSRGVERTSARSVARLSGRAALRGANHVGQPPGLSRRGGRSVRALRRQG